MTYVSKALKFKTFIFSCKINWLLIIKLTSCEFTAIKSWITSYKSGENQKTERKKKTQTITNLCLYHCLLFLFTLGTLECQLSVVENRVCRMVLQRCREQGVQVSKNADLWECGVPLSKCILGRDAFLDALKASGSIYMPLVLDSPLSN